MNIYFDNAATSFPKPPEVIKAVTDALINFGGNSGRGSSSLSMDSNRIVYNCRESLCNFFNYEHTENLIFTNNITSSLNILLFSVVKPDWHIITTSMEHNSVLRPLFKLKEDLNIELSVVEASPQGLVDINKIKQEIKHNTKLIILSHSSNLVGTIQPIEEIGLLCRDNDIFFILDTAQTAGVLPIDMKKNNINALAFTGHKSLLAPQGIGGFIIDNNLNEIAKPVFVGGTGSHSHSVITPDFLPDKFECGTLNLPGINGLLAGIKFINNIGIHNIKAKEEELCQFALQSLLDLEQVTIYGPIDSKQKTSTMSFNINGLDASEVGFYLDREFGISTRTGLHCAPLAHKTVGTYPSGSVRISLGYFNTIDEIKYFKDCMYKLIKGGFYGTTY